MYAAYGINMDPDHMSAKAPRSPHAGTGWLHGWRLTFAGGHIESGLPESTAVATVVEDPASSVFVVLYDVTDAELAFLDRWEGTDQITPQRLRARVSTLPTVPGGPPVSAQASEFSVSGVNKKLPSGDEVLAWFYVMDAYEGGLPLATYLGRLADAAETAGAPEDYVHELRTRPCQAD